MQDKFITDVWTNFDSEYYREIAGLRVSIPESFLYRAEVLAKALSCEAMHVATQDSNYTGIYIAVMVYDDDDNEDIVEDEAKKPYFWASVCNSTGIDRSLGCDSKDIFVVES